MTMIFADGVCLPHTQDFARLRTHRERARWLLSAPLDTLRRDHAALCVMCREAGFGLGEVYVGAELVALTATRKRGEVSFWKRDMVRTLRAMLRQEAGYVRQKSWFYRWKFW